MPSVYLRNQWKIMLTTKRHGNTQTEKFQINKQQFEVWTCGFSITSFSRLLDLFMQKKRISQRKPVMSS